LAAAAAVVGRVRTVLDRQEVREVTLLSTVKLWQRAVVVVEPER
jgi:hypothetical protein